MKKIIFISLAYILSVNAYAYTISVPIENKSQLAMHVEQVPTYDQHGTVRCPASGCDIASGATSAPFLFIAEEPGGISSPELKLSVTIASAARGNIWGNFSVLCNNTFYQCSGLFFDYAKIAENGAAGYFTANIENPHTDGSGGKIIINYTPPATELHNNSQMYLVNTDLINHPACPTVLAPGRSTLVKDTGCYFNACATEYQDNGSCMEVMSARNHALTSGGYAGWVSISSMDTNSPSCAIPGSSPEAGTNPYTCGVSKNGSVFFNLWSYKSLTQRYTAGRNNGALVTLTVPKSYSSLPYRGINLSGLEYNGTYLDAMYQLPDLPDMQYFVAQGMNTVRIPIRAEYLYSDFPNEPGNSLSSSHLNADGTLPLYPNPIYRAAIKDIVSKYLNNHVNVILDLHNYMRFCPTGPEVGQGNGPTDPVGNHCKILTSTQLALIWQTISTEFKDLAVHNPQTLIFGLQNEPFTQSDNRLTTQQVFDSEVEAIKKMRMNGIESNIIIMSGNYWDPLHGWLTESAPGDVPNGSVFTLANLRNAGIADTSNLVIEMHQYFDSDFSGRSDVCIKYADYDRFKSHLKLANVSKWMNDNKMKVMLNEFGSADNQICKEDLAYMFQYINEHTLGKAGNENGGFVGWTAWRANRRSQGTGFGWFNYLNQANYEVYGGNGTKPQSPNGTGITQGPANGLMDSIYAGQLR